MNAKYRQRLQTALSSALKQGDVEPLRAMITNCRRVIPASTFQQKLANQSIYNTYLNQFIKGVCNGN